MRFFVVFACALAAVSAGYAGYAGAPQLVGNGVPAETPEVQQARAAHLAALAEANARSEPHGGAPSYDGHSSYSGPSSYAAPAYAPSQAGPAHQYIGASPDGHPLDTAEVEAEKARHFAAFSQALSRAGPIEGQGAPSYNPAPAYNPAPSYNHAYNQAPAYNPAPAYNQAPAYHGQGIPNTAQIHNGLHIPTINNGVPVETAEVQQAKAAHFAAFSKIAPSPQY